MWFRVLGLFVGGVLLSMTTCSAPPGFEGTGVRGCGEKAAKPRRATYGRAYRRSTAAAAAGGIGGPLAGTAAAGGGGARGGDRLLLRKRGLTPGGVGLYRVRLSRAPAPRRTERRGFAAY